MRARLLERQLAFACVAVLAVAVSLAVTTRHQAGARAAALPQPVGSYTALVGSSNSGSSSGSSSGSGGTTAGGRPTACGVVIEPGTVGISSPVLPCGMRLYLDYHGRHVLAPVIGRGPSAPGREFDLTRALARRLGIAGVRRIRWSYAGGS